MAADGLFDLLRLFRPFSLRIFISFSLSLSRSFYFLFSYFFFLLSGFASSIGLFVCFFSFRVHRIRRCSSMLFCFFVVRIQSISVELAVKSRATPFFCLFVFFWGLLRCSGGCAARSKEVAHLHISVSFFFFLVFIFFASLFANVP